MQQIADKLSDLLIRRGSDEATARFAGQIAIACYQTAKCLGNNPRTLVDETFRPPSGEYSHSGPAPGPRRNRVVQDDLTCMPAG